MKLPPAVPGETARAAVALDPGSLRARFDEARPQLVGLEEELMVVHAETLDLLPSAPQLLAKLADDALFKLELPASQIEIVIPPRRTMPELTEDLEGARLRLCDAAGGQACLLAAGVHPFAPGEGKLNLHDRYAAVAGEYGIVARRQLVCGLHVHISLPGADRTLAVYNALRSYLPLLAALAANAPIYEGRDTGLASVRPLISGLLPRQGIPPELDSWEQLCSELAWGARTGRVERVRGWWWELRIHPELATLEIRVPDAQSTVAEAAAVGTVAASLAVRLGELHDAGELPPAAPAWRIAENRWSAARDGTRGHMHDLVTGEARATRELLAELLEQLHGAAAAIGGERQLAQAERLLEHNGADRQRDRLQAADGARGVARELTRVFVPRR